MFPPTWCMGLDQLVDWLPPGSPDEALARQVQFDRLPRHIAIIMDGNGRWAAKRHLPRVEGHRAGIEAVRAAVETSARLGIGVLTLYAFSLENWKRPETEVSTLMLLLKRYLRSELTTLLANDIRFNVIGRVNELAPDIRAELDEAAQKTASSRGMLFNIALNYGGRAEIVDAARRAIESGIRPWCRSPGCRSSRCSALRLSPPQSTSWPRIDREPQRCTTLPRRSSRRSISACRSGLSWPSTASLGVRPSSCSS
ncbi:MAG: di-trans,poly-cis-decaprenylcistransferase [Acidobacteria bacterium]|nr:di-trans,poly-cis-decaprenylcistransferase [Acidobacteriota bacterium]